jgi:hypothetical protein
MHAVSPSLLQNEIMQRSRDACTVAGAFSLFGFEKPQAAIDKTFHTPYVHYD